MTHPPVGVPTCYRHSDRETYIRCQRCEKPICPDCMREASVGFQCPDCVAEGARTTRQARTAYGGAITGNPGLVTMVLIGINAVVWVAIMVTGRYTSRLYELFGLTPVGTCRVEGGGTVAIAGSQASCDTLPIATQFVPGVADGAVWQLMTSVFTHVEPWHIGFNMLALWVLGPQLEAVLGRGRYLALYLLSGLAGSVTVLWLSAEASSTVGASGAIFGLMGALAVVGYKIGANMSSLAFWIGINVVLTFTLSNVSWQGHFGGLVGGAVIAAILVYAPRERRTPVQVAGLAAVGALLVVATVLRIAQLS